jgi:hypothetical protein
VPGEQDGIQEDLKSAQDNKVGSTLSECFCARPQTEQKTGWTHVLRKATVEARLYFAEAKPASFRMASRESLTEFPKLIVEWLNIESPSRLNTATLFL